MSHAQAELTQAELTRLELLISFMEQGSGPPATPAEIDRAEAQLGRPLPAQLRAWVESVDGAVLAGGNLRFDRIWGAGSPDQHEHVLTTRTSALRDAGRDLPAELLVIGDDAADRLFGLWAPAESGAPHVVVAFDREPSAGDESFWLVGSSLLAFLTAWATAYAHLHHGAIYELLQVPAELESPVQDSVVVDGAGRAVAAEDTARLTAVLQWASPEIPGLTWPGTPERALSADELRDVAATLPASAEHIAPK